MNDVARLRRDVEWWIDEVRAREGKVREAVAMLEQRQKELMRAEEAEAKEGK